MMRKVTVLATLLLACGGDGVNTPELKAALSKARPSGETPTQRIAKTPVPMSGATAHRAEDRFELSLKFKDGARTLVIERRIERGDPSGSGQFRVLQTRHWTDPKLASEGRTDGREAVFDGRRFASRRRQGPWRQREIWRGDHYEWLRLAYSVGPSLMRAYGPLLSLSRQGTVNVAGIAGERFTVRLNTSVRLKRLSEVAIESLRDTDTHWYQWLAATHAAATVSGEILRRAGADEVLAGNLKIAGTATVEGLAVPFTLTWKRVVTATTTGAATFDLPKKLEPARRERPWLMIRSVVREALADVYGKRAGK